MGLLSRIFGTIGSAGQQDGQAEALTALATGISVDALDGALAEAPAGRRDRPLPSPAAVVTLALAEKVLHGWLQNRHQTLYPLTVNIATLEPRGAALLAPVMAVALLAASDSPATAEAEAWLSQAGGDASALRTALAAPPPLDHLLRDVREAGIAPYAYIVALAAGAWRDPAGRLFLDYLAVRLALPIEVVRSANRRHRR